MNKNLKFIQIGTGGFGEYWCKETIPYITGELGIATLTAAVDINPEAHKNAIEFAGLSKEKCYTDARKAFEENEADFAVIVVPPKYHEQMVDLALEHNCHILSEKPIAHDMDACCRIYKKVKDAGKKMAVTMSHRFDQDKQTLEGLLKSGEYGAINYISGRFTESYREPLPEGSFRRDMEEPLLAECSVHHFDIFRSLSSSNAKTVFAKTWHQDWSIFNGNISGTVFIEMESGVHAFYEGSMVNAARLNSWGSEYFRAECEKATIEMDHRVIKVKKALDVITEEVSTIPLKQQRKWMNPRLAELFINWVNGGKEPENSIEDNIQCAALLYAAVESAHTGKTVDVQDFLKQHMERGNEHGR